jgi:hypothetical protein
MSTIGPNRLPNDSLAKMRRGIVATVIAMTVLWIVVTVVAELKASANALSIYQKGAILAMCLAFLALGLRNHLKRYRALASDSQAPPDGHSPMPLVVVPVDRMRRRYLIASAATWIGLNAGSGFVAVRMASAPSLSIYGKGAIVAFVIWFSVYGLYHTVKWYRYLRD